MLNIARRSLLAAGSCGTALLLATFAVAQETSSSATPSNTNTQSAQPSAPNPSNVASPETAQTEQQSKAPVVDPHAAAAEHSVTTPASPRQAGSTQGTITQQWPAPQRYDSGRGAGSNTASRPGGASLGVNVVGSEDGRGLVVSRIRPGTPAQQMGLQPRDRILGLNGQPVNSVDQFIAAIRGMAAGDEIQLSIDRDGNARDVGGRLEAFRDSVAAGQGPVNNILGRAREVIGRERIGGENMQTVYEEGNQNSLRSSGDVEARIARLEQQIERLTQEIQQLRSSGSNSQTGSLNAQPGASAPSTLDSPPGQSQSLQPPTK